jgi:two-component system copper resistance phosphate regulon response regulator CusR
MRILIIDDNLVLAQSTKVALEQHGYVVNVANTVEEGDEVASVNHHDAIILDVMLGNRDGVELCRQLRRRQVATPILMLTVMDSTKDKIRGLDAGADDYLTKPFEMEELLARLRSLMRRSQATEGAMLRAGTLVMDLHEHRVTANGVPVKLAGKEFALLEYFMRNPRKLLTRTMISESVWDMNYESSSNIIDVYVSNLRRKIDAGTVSLIETVIGSGYRFVSPSEQSEAPTRAGPGT